MVVLSKDKLDQLWSRLWAKFNTYSTDRYQLEQQWLRNLRQYKALYDPEVKIGDGLSKVYPKDTHTKIVGWVAKMMEMMFPAQERNWEINPTPFPNIAQADLQNIIDALTAQQLMVAQRTQQPPQEVTDDMIEKAVKEFARQRALEMSKECEDQLSDEGIDYPELCKRVIRRGGIYGFGVAEGPQVRTQKEQVYVRDPITGQYAAKTVAKKRPYYTVLKSWDVYPDLSAQTWGEQEGIFIRKALSRQGLRALAKRDDFFGSEINKFLADHNTGTYKPRGFESELNEVKKTDQNQANVEARQFEVIRWYGFVSANDLEEIGVTIPANAKDKDILADIWMVDGAVIKADTAPFGEGVSDMFHVFIPEEDEDGPLTGTAKVEVLRDSQLKLCAIDRALMDNMAESARSIKEVNDDLIDRSQRPGDISGGMTIHRNGEGSTANYPALRFYDVPNHTAPLLNLRKNVLEVFDVESNLPSWRMGNAQPLGEAFRTSNNMSMMAGGGDMVTKDDVRSFDRFVKSLIGSLVRWNMEFGTRPEIKGDFQVMPKGSISLVAKEVRGAALDQLNATLSPRDRVQIDERKLLLDRLRSRDLPVDYLLDEEEARKALEQFDAAQSQAAQVQQGLDESKTQMQLAAAEEKAARAEELRQTITTKVQEGLSRIALNMAKGKGVKDGNAMQAIKLLLQDLGAEGPGGAVAEPVAGEAEEQRPE